MEYSEHITDALVEKAKDGDQDAFGEIFEAFVSPVYRFALFRTGSQKHSEQLTEEIFSKVLKNIRKFRSHGSISFAVWLFQISHTTVHNFLERLKRTSITRKNFIDPQNLENTSEGNTEQKKLILAFTQLPHSQAESIILKYFCHLSNIEAGIILEKTEGAVRILQSRGFKRLREITEE